MKLATLTADLALSLPPGAADLDVNGVVCDSREVRPGFLFVAISGTALDGQAYISDAVTRGASVIVSAAAPGMTCPCHIRVDDVRVTLAELAARFHGHPSRKLQAVGITGTNGKTTTAGIIRDVLRADGRAPGLIGTIQYEIGGRAIPAARTTPDAAHLQRLLADMVNADCGSVVMEVSSHALDQHRVAGVAFDVAVFTNLSRDHLDYHHTMETYFAAKARLFQGLAGGGDQPATAVVHLDAWGRRMLEQVPEGVTRLTFGRDAAAAVRAEAVALSADGSRFRLVSPWGTADLTVGLLGRYNVDNVLAATGACGALGVPFAKIVDALGRVGPAPGRMEPVPCDRGFKVYVDYAHTDDALEHLLTTLREITAGRLIVVFGCGGDRDRSKRPAMGRVAGALADHAVVTSDNPRSEDASAITDDIAAGFGASGSYRVIEDRREAIKAALSLASPGDTVVVAGKGHETYQQFANRTIPFDDREVVRGALEDLD